MDRRGSFGLVSSALAVALTVTPAFAQDDGLQDQLDAMRQMLEEIQSERDDMRHEIDDLRAQLDDDWLTEARADEIRMVVEDVLADADVRTSLLDGGMPAGWNDHFFLASPDGRFKLQLEGWMQYRYLVNKNRSFDEWVHGFDTVRTALIFRGHVFNPSMQYYIRSMFARQSSGGVDGTRSHMGGDLSLLEAWIRYVFDDSWSIKGGQFKTPFNREELVQSKFQQAVDRTLVNYSHNLGLTQGLEIMYSDPAWNMRFSFNEGGDDQLGGFGTLGRTTPQNTQPLVQQADWGLTARYEGLVAGNWAQFRDFTSPPGDPFGMMIGIAGHAQQLPFGTGGAATETFRAGLTADVSIEGGGWNLFGSIVYTYVDDPQFDVFRVTGLVLQGGLYIAPKWEVFGRFEYDAWDSKNTFDPENLLLATAGVVWYIDGHDLKWTSDISYGFNQVDSSEDSVWAGFRVDPTDADPQIVFRTQFQLLF